MLTFKTMIHITTQNKLIIKSFYNNYIFIVYIKCNNICMKTKSKKKKKSLTQFVQRTKSGHLYNVICKTFNV